MTDLDLMTRIFDRLGAIDAKLAAGERRHDKFDASFATINARLAPVEQLVPVVAAMKPVVEDYQANRNKAVGILLALTTTASVLGAFASELKAMIFRN